MRRYTTIPAKFVETYELIEFHNTESQRLYGSFCKSPDFKPCVVAVDFDGTLTSKDTNLGGKPTHLNKKAAEVVQSLFESGYFIVINSCRESVEDLCLMYEFLCKHRIPFHTINKSLINPNLSFRQGAKVYADVYVDDRQVCGLPSWKKIETYIITKFPIE